MKETNKKKVCSCLIKIYFRLTLNLNAFELFVLVISLTTKLFFFLFFPPVKSWKGIQNQMWFVLFTMNSVVFIHSSFFIVVHHSQFNWLSWLSELKTLLMSWRCHSRVKDCKQSFTLALIYYMLCLVVCNICMRKYKHNFWTDHHHQNIGFQIETEYT